MGNNRRHRSLFIIVVVLFPAAVLAGPTEPRWPRDEGVAAAIEKPRRDGLGKPAETTPADLAVRSYPLPNHGVFELLVPVTWTDEVRQPPGELPPSILFNPATGNHFHLLVTPVWSMQPGGDVATPEKLKATVTIMGERVLPTAVETELTVLELKHGESIGYYYLVTDKASGGFPYMIQGAVGTGDLLVSFTLLLKEKDSAARQSILDMLISARHRR